MLIRGHRVFVTSSIKRKDDNTFRIGGEDGRTAALTASFCMYPR